LSCLEYPIGNNLSKLDLIDFIGVMNECIVWIKKHIIGTSVIIFTIFKLRLI